VSKRVGISAVGLQAVRPGLDDKFADHVDRFARQIDETTGDLDVGRLVFEEHAAEMEADFRKRIVDCSAGHRDWEGDAEAVQHHR
jgi:hypothetical protein